jgi:hypothetical protein
MSIWYLFPSANSQRAAETTAKWKACGYKVGILTDGDPGEVTFPVDKHWHIDAFISWGHAQNLMIADVMKADSKLGAVIAGSDDVDPDPTQSDGMIIMSLVMEHSGFNFVMQPTGDKYGAWETCAPHPWLGWEYLERNPAPFFEGYHHLYVDQEFRDVATAQGVFSTRDDIVQYHHHWGREGEIDTLPPERRQSIKGHLEIDRALYEERKAQGFPR